MRRYFYLLLRRYISLFILPHNSVVEIDPTTSLLVASMAQGKVSFRQRLDTQTKFPDISDGDIVPFDAIGDDAPDYLVISGLIHYDRDIQALFASLHARCREDTKLIIIYYSALWRPLATIASFIGLRQKSPEQNWLGHADVFNLLLLENFDLIRKDSKVLMPFYIPVVSNFVNRFIAPLPIFRNLCLMNIVVARPTPPSSLSSGTSISIIVPARNEEGNIDQIMQRIPAMGPDDEIIFVEGNSTDNTWQAITDAQVRYGNKKRVVIVQQEGRGKGDAVRKGFSLARNEILMILDADMTVAPEDLPKFHRAIADNKGELVIGSRLVYPYEKEAMQFFNLIGNKFFAVAFSFVLDQRLKDTLCGTKVISRSNYLRLAANRSYFGDFDPFGDFDLIFGAARMGLKIVEVPIGYRQRVYGQTNISRWRHGVILLAMLSIAAKKIKFL